MIPFKSVWVPPSEISSEPIVKELFASLEFAIEPASCVLVIPDALTVTAPDVTAKSSEEKDAIPLLDAVASSAAIVIALFATVVSIPSPPKNVRVSPVLKVSLEPLSAARVNVVLTVAKESVPEPFVLRTWSALPSALGNVNATLPDNEFGEFNCRWCVPLLVPSLIWI